ncbi:MAG: hypothetical protein LBS95_01275 [Mycoplasmataceae bacterium]|jgi:hypothetical protein|nr:hypothetical protein [Mycoplasmataceae bacterium]
MTRKYRIKNAKNNKQLIGDEIELETIIKREMKNKRTKKNKMTLEKLSVVIIETKNKIDDMEKILKQHTNILKRNNLK